jgi:hypothetical protein
MIFEGDSKAVSTQAVISMNEASGWASAPPMKMSKAGEASLRA